jgi:hypothetical protein
MKTLSELKKQGFEGCDISLEISLFEYGLVCKKHPDGDIQCWYGLGADNSYNYNKFDSGHITEKEIKNTLNESWFDKKSFLSFVGCTEEEWLVRWCGNKISDLIEYYGYENIFGSCYDPIEIENK